MPGERRRLDSISRHTVLDHEKTHPPFNLHKPRLRQDGLAFHFTPSRAGAPCRAHPHPLCSARLFLMRGEMFVPFAICDCLNTTMRSIPLHSTDSITKEPPTQPSANDLP